MRGLRTSILLQINFSNVMSV